MMRTAFIVLLALTVTGCGVRRSLIKPEDVPAYEERKKRELEEFEQRRDEEARDRQLYQSIQRP